MHSVLSSWSVFLAPMAAILVADYFLVRHQELHVADLHVGNSSSAYWYTAGFNWRAILAWCAPILIPCSLTPLYCVHPA